MRSIRHHLQAALCAVSLFSVGCGGAATPAADIVTRPPLEVGTPTTVEPEAPRDEGRFQLEIDRDPKSPERIIVKLRWTGKDVLRFTRGRATSHCGVNDWRVTLKGDDGSTYISTPRHARRLCYQVIVPERTYEFKQDTPVVVASFLTRHLIPIGGVSPVAKSGRYQVFVQATFTVVAAQSEETILL